MKLSIIIVSYNVRELLTQCLDSIIATCDRELFEIIVIDNNSSDDSVKIISEKYSLVKLFSNEHNVGFSEANNQGIAKSSGEYILLLNPDTEVKPGAISKMLSFADGEKKLFLLGPQLLNSDGTLQMSAWKKQGTGNVIAESLFLHQLLHVSEYSPEIFQKTFHPGMVSGAAMFFPKQLTEKIGGLDPDLFWMEDADLCYRAAKGGAEIIYFPEAEIIHHSGQSSKKNLKVVISNQLLSKLKYIRKHHGVFFFIIASMFCFFQIVSRILIFGLIGIFSTRYAEKAGAYAFSWGRYFKYLFAGDKRVTIVK